jgi:MacB-like periplasmic core domain
VDAVLLRSLPYRDPERLVMLYGGLPGAPGPIGFSAPDYAGFRERATSYEAVAAFQNKTYELSGVYAPERVTGARISAELFGVLGVTPALGRDLSPEDDRGARPVVLLSDALWARAFARDPAIVSRSIVLDRASYTVVGVMPRGFVFPCRGLMRNDRPADVYVPMSFTSQELAGFGSMYNHSVVARLKPDVPPTAAAAEAKTLASQIVRELYPAEFQPPLTIHVTPFRDEVVGRVRTLLARCRS